MERVFVEHRTLDKVSFREKPLKIGEYENCVFQNCDFSESDISDVKFVECKFADCNLSVAKIRGTSFRDVEFKDCKMLGLRFDECGEFLLSFNFDNCALDHSSFYKLKLKKTVFKDSQLKETDFTECDLSEAIFNKCNLARATFVNTNLEKADLRTAFNYSLDPEFNRIKKARFSLPSVIGLLDKYDLKIEE